jgi:beta-galactosidase
MRYLFSFILLVFLLPTAGRTQQQANSFAIGETHFLLNGKPFLIRCGEMHFARIPKAYWRHRLQMARAMGLNAVCAYLFWNLHEKEKDQFSWEGQADAAAFCRMAQEEGLKVILRPGPYACAEWDLGGFPWWLLKDKEIKLRTRYPYYLERCKKYLQEVGRVLAPLQISNGGPIIMVQVENEYGSYGSDTAYVNTIKDYVQQAGFTVPLFHCDGPTQLKKDHPANLFAVVNFGSNPESSFDELRKIQPAGPLMCGEFYPGWFDSWGRAHHTGQSANVIADLKWMLDNQASFSIYMAHGGTTFGTYAGANAPPYSPQTSSYDYDAPIDEAGNATPKFFAIRELFSHYLQLGEALPPVPAPIQKQKPAAVQFFAFASLRDNLPAPVVSDSALLMEDLNQDFGSVLYRNTLEPGPAATLLFEDVHDYALVYLNRKLLGTIDRRKNSFHLNLPARTTNMVLEILVEAMGRVNYGTQLHDRKGIHGQVLLVIGDKTTELHNWANYPLRMGTISMPLRYLTQSKAGPGFYKGQFQTTEAGDTYLDMKNWNKGLVWINGICLGRFWNIGPTQTMFVPGCWLKKGVNEVVVFDLFGLPQPVLEFSDSPVLDQLTEQKTQAHKKPGQKWRGTGAQYQGRLADHDQWQSVSFSPVTARYFCLEALNEFNNQPYTSLAELQLTDDKGKEIPGSAWKLVYADSEEINGEDGNAANVFDLQPTSIWHTEWQSASPRHPHQLVIDLGKNYRLSGMKILQRQDGKNGRIKDFRLYFSTRTFPGLD